MKKMDYAEFEAACRELAKATLWTGGEASADIIETQTHNLMKRSESNIAYIADMGRDPNMLTRAIRYIAHTHAIPPMGTDIEWFAATVECLIELAVPNAGQTVESSAFLHDLQEGISEWTAANDS
ncbi:hypothetical protein [Achromobacter denitrificans]|uniref:Prophage protein n=1 Tax=Achromobacter denitrificans TaxID=32002 RepID=A0ABZ3G9A9_ACHDE|nr:hypothetical protein [Achromobacter denitrificans]CAB3861031.1 hypothetical protein LMG1860_03331 [Achromobacter denitrificans]